MAADLFNPVFVDRVFDAPVHVPPAIESSASADFGSLVRVGPTQWTYGPTSTESSGLRVVYVSNPPTVAPQPLGEPPAAAPTQSPAKSPFIGLRPATIPETTKDDEAGKVSGEVYLGELQNTDVGSKGEWGAAAYQGKTRYLHAAGSAGLEDDASKGKLSAKAEGEANLFKTEHKGQYSTPTVEIGGKEAVSSKVTGEAKLNVGVDGSAEAGVNWVGSKAGVKAEAKSFAGAQVKGEAGMENRVLGIESKSSSSGFARAGAEVNGEATARLDKGLALEGSAFAGAKAGGELKSSIGGIGLSVEGEAWAGPGAEAGVSFKKQDDGKIKFKTNLGASPIVGGKTGIGFEIDPKEVVKWADLPANVRAVDKAISEDEGLKTFGANSEAFVTNSYNDGAKATDAVITQFAETPSVASNVWNSVTSWF